MLETILHLVAPEAKMPSGSTPLALGHEGLDWSWAIVIFVLLSILLVWSYRRFVATLSVPARFGLIFLRCFLLVLLLLVLIRPILLLPVEKGVRHQLLVLLDLSKSMGQVDSRNQPSDLMRAAIATGAVDPAAGLDQSLLGVNTDGLGQTTRAQLLQALAVNSRLNLWPRLQAVADLDFYGFGQQLRELGPLSSQSAVKPTIEECGSFFQKLRHDDNLTAIGDGLRDLLDQKQGDPLAGILLITDGGNNTGSLPTDAAALAAQDNVPLFIYGVGVEAPRDIVVTELTAPAAANVTEKFDLTVHFHTQGLIGHKTSVQLKVQGAVVAEEPLDIRADGEQEVNFSYTPTEVGDVNLTAYIPPLAEEAAQNNNTATVLVHVVDRKVNVLLVEGDPRWEYQYLLAMLQRDRRIRVKCVLLNGDSDLTEQPESSFLEHVPEDKSAIDFNEVVILGDVDPAQLGEPRMNLLQGWVKTLGGGLIFLSGRKFNPSAYRETPLAPLLPVEPRMQGSETYPDGVKLKLTAEGAISPLLVLSKNPEENDKIWSSFQGVRWTAPVEKTRPEAQVLLVDPSPEKAVSGQPLPVMALEGYGLGHSLYIGFDETYLWRANIGEKYYTQIWGQIIQYLAAQRLLEASPLTQLKTNRSRYFTGDKIQISGHLLKRSFDPLTDPDVPGTMVITTGSSSRPVTAQSQSTELSLHAVPGQPGEYRGEMIAQAPGNYSYNTQRDTAGILKFQVAESTVELSDTAMNEKLLRQMAATSGGRFLREEDLHGLPDLIAKQSTVLVSFQRIPLTTTPWLLGLMIFTACVEWLWRRKQELK